MKKKKLFNSALWLKTDIRKKISSYIKNLDSDVDCILSIKPATVYDIRHS